MDLAIVQIGNSKGIRLSKTLLEKYNIKDKVELILEEGHIILKPIEEPRKGWEKAFKKMHENGHDRSLMNHIDMSKPIKLEEGRIRTNVKELSKTPKPAIKPAPQKAPRTGQTHLN